jgi:hypothetical protein
VSTFHEIEAIYRQRIRDLESLLKSAEENDLTDNYSIDSYVEKQTLASYINNYRLALSGLNGKCYLGHDKDWWLADLTPLEKTIWNMRFKQKKGFKEIERSAMVAGADKIYEITYRKVISTIQKSMGR